MHLISVSFYMRESLCLLLIFSSLLSFSQLLTTFCLEYPPTVVACMCIHLTCAWKGLEVSCLTHVHVLQVCKYTF